MAQKRVLINELNKLNTKEQDRVIRGHNNAFELKEQMKLVHWQVYIAGTFLLFLLVIISIIRKGLFDFFFIVERTIKHGFN